jgi:cytochrome c biogenesis protein
VGIVIRDGNLMTDTETRATEPPPAVDVDKRPELPALGPGGALRYLWTQLTSMRTALVLLFALALAAVPGSLVPQRKVSPIGVSDFIRDHPTLGPIYDKLGMFNVYSSPWFSAIYLLLFLSLAGCIVPRLGIYARALRARPPATPRNLSRLPAYAQAEVGETAGVLEEAAERLRRQHYRVDNRENSVAAERGYLREAGNLLFHLSLLFVLLGVAIGSLFGFRGTSVVVVGQGFANNLTQYDDFSAAAAFRESDLRPFSVTVKDFQVKFETGSVQRGAARLFSADVEVVERPGAAPRSDTLEVNKPLQIGGTKVHLLGHGYAPKVTVRDGSGNVAYSGPVVFLPQDGNFTSAGAIKAPDARPERLAFQGFFLPTAVVDEYGPRSVFPDALNPALFINAWHGPPKVETGIPENVYSLDTAGLTQFKDKTGDPLRYALQTGDVIQLPDGKGSISLDGWVRWVKLQVGETPGMPIVLTAIGAAVLGLCLSLFVRPRRVWIKIRTDATGSSLVDVGGLDRADARAGLIEDIAELAAEISAARPAADGSAAASKERARREP